MRRIISTLVLLVASILPAAVSGSVALAQCSFAPGSVVQLAGTPHLFIVDDQSVLHWGGDTRALAGRTIQWSNRCDVGLDALRNARRGDPWLSSGLPKIGDPIYLSKWEDDEATPRLLHIQSISDVELFGINSANYLNFVMERGTWQGRFGFDVGLLQVGPLASAASFAWSEADRTAYGRLLTNVANLMSATLFRMVQGGTTDAAVALTSVTECERQGLADFDRTRNAAGALGITQDCLNRLTPGTPPTTVPRTPANVRVTVQSTTTLRLTWDDVADETGYRVLGGEQFGSPTTLVTTLPANTTSYEIGGRTSGITYCYSVVAFNAGGDAPTSSATCGTPGSVQSAPQTPTNLRLTVQTAPNVGIRLDWFDNSTNEEGFRILRAEQVIATVGSNVVSYTDFTWTSATVGCFRVAAFNTAGQAIGDLVCPGSSTTGPAVPTNVRVTVLPSGGNRIEWTDASANEDGFRILVGSNVLATVGPNITSFVDTTGFATTCYIVASFNTSGQTPSGSVCGGTLPAAPTNLRLTPGAGNIRLDWNDNATNEDGFRVLRGGNLLATLSPNTTTFTDTSPAVGANCYVVAAFTAGGDVTSTQVCSIP